RPALTDYLASPSALTGALATYGRGVPPRRDTVSSPRAPLRRGGGAATPAGSRSRPRPLPTAARSGLGTPSHPELRRDNTTSGSTALAAGVIAHGARRPTGQAP